MLVHVEVDEPLKKATGKRAAWGPLLKSVLMTA